MPNLLQHSSRLGISPWANTWGGGTTLTENNLLAPDGSTTADKIERLATPAAAVTQNIVLTAAKRHTYAAFAKTDDSTGSRVAIRNESAGTIFVELDTNWVGAVPSVLASTGATNVEYRPVGDDWYRVSFSFTTGSSDTSYRVLSYPAIGGVAGDGVWVWGFNLEPELLGKHINTSFPNERTDNRNLRAGVRHKRSQF